MGKVVFVWGRAATVQDVLLSKQPCIHANIVCLSDTTSESLVWMGNSGWRKYSKGQVVSMDEIDIQLLIDSIRIEPEGGSYYQPLLKTHAITKNEKEEFFRAG